MLAKGKDQLSNFSRWQAAKGKDRVFTGEKFPVMPIQN